MGTVNANGANALFIFANIALVMNMYHRIDDSTEFYLMAGGLLTFSFFLRRAINQIVQ